jgi:biotin operon repressor
MSSPRLEALDRDQQILSRLSKIEHKVDSIEQTNAFALRAEAGKHLAEVKKIFRNSSRKAQVYLAANGDRSVQDLAKHLGVPRQNLSPLLKHLSEEGLLEIVDSEGRGDIWAKKSVDRSVRITPFLCAEFGLQKDGLRQKVTRARKGKKARKVKRT